MELLSKSVSNTQKVAADLILNEKDFSKPIVFLLYGELGSGKTTFAKGIGEVLGVKKMVSPSFVVSCEYELLDENIKKLIHFDFYNLKDSEYDLIGIDESLQPGNIVIIEWPDNNENVIEKISKIAKVIEIKFEHVNESSRKLLVSRHCEECSDEAIPSRSRHGGMTQ
jgi:tRNA threonylcarbamoyladenosine biosynthesis protein TsaE